MTGRNLPPSFRLMFSPYPHREALTPAIKIGGSILFAPEN
jgi:hypothetical protein